MGPRLSVLRTSVLGLSVNLEFGRNVSHCGTQMLLCKRSCSAGKRPVLYSPLLSWKAPSELFLLHWQDVSLRRPLVHIPAQLQPLWLPPLSLSFPNTSSVFSPPLFSPHPDFSPGLDPASTHSLEWRIRAPHRANLLPLHFRWIPSPALFLCFSDCSRQSLRSPRWKDVGIKASTNKGE